MAAHSPMFANLANLNSSQAILTLLQAMRVRNNSTYQTQVSNYSKLCKLDDNYQLHGRWSLSAYHELPFSCFHFFNDTFDNNLINIINYSIY